ELFLEDYKKQPKIEELPEIHFKMELEIDDDEDIITNIAPLLFLDNTKSATLNIKVQIKETEEFNEKLSEKLKGSTSSQDEHFKLLLKAIDEVGLESVYLNNDYQEIKDFNLKNLIEIKSIEANKITHENSLTKAFNKIIGYRHKKNKVDTSASIDAIIDNI